jgi:hypothetical protein
MLPTHAVADWHSSLIRTSVVMELAAGRAHLAIAHLIRNLSFCYSTGPLKADRFGCGPIDAGS